MQCRFQYILGWAWAIEARSQGFANLLATPRLQMLDVRMMTLFLDQAPDFQMSPEWQSTIILRKWNVGRSPHPIDIRSAWLKPDYKVKAPQFLINLAKPYNLNPKP